MGVDRGLHGNSTQNFYFKNCHILRISASSPCVAMEGFKFFMGSLALKV